MSRADHPCRYVVDVDRNHLTAEWSAVLCSQVGDCVNWGMPIDLCQYHAALMQDDRDEAQEWEFVEFQPGEWVAMPTEYRWPTAPSGRHEPSGQPVVTVIRRG